MKDWNIILASASPRRRLLLKRAGFDFSVVASNCEEIFPAEMDFQQVPEYLAKLKAESVKEQLKNDNDLIISADTLVLKDKVIYGKPVDQDDALRILKELNGATHEVITGVCFMTPTKTTTFSETTAVTFSRLTDDQLLHYILKYKPYDKAGAYAIQEWIGLVGIKEVRGCYTNVVGLPVNRLYAELDKF